MLGSIKLGLSLALWVLALTPFNSTGRMLPPLDHEQKTVLLEALSEARHQGASHKETKALIEALLVESGIRNLNYGDRDSLGPLQQRPSQGWKHPRNVRLAVRDFLKAARPLRNKYALASGVAQGVQRSGFPGRYQDVAGKAEALYAHYAGSPMARQGQSTSAVSLGGGKQSTTNNLSQIQDLSKKVAFAQYLQRTNPNSLLLRLGVVDPNASIPPLEVTTTALTTGHSKVKIADPTGHIRTGHHGPLYEMFWQGAGGINVKNGKKVAQGFVSGHTDHVHLAAPEATVVQLGKLAQSMGLHVGEQPHFGKVHRVHVQNSYHYKNEAIDVSGSPGLMRRYAHRVAAIYGIR